MVSPCGVYCGHCLAYRNDKCDGCAEMTKALKLKGEVFCDISTCSGERGYTACVDCGDYPCDKFSSSKQSIFSKDYVDWIRQNCRKSSCQ